MQTIDFERLKIHPSHKVLDIGCGEGRHTLFTRFFTPADLVIGIDINCQDVQQARMKEDDFGASISVSKHSCYLAGDALKLPFCDQQFDIIICSEVLEHIPNYTQVLCEIDRVLKPGGQFAVSVPRYWPEKICWWLSREYHEVKGGHVRIFTTRKLKNALKPLGFTFLHRHWAHALHSPFWWLRCALWNRQEHSRVIQLYHRFLLWDLMKKPRFSRYLEKLLNPLIGKSVVLYYTK